MRWKSALLACTACFLILAGVRAWSTVIFLRNAGRVYDLKEEPVEVNRMRGKLLRGRFDGSADSALKAVLGEDALVTGDEALAVGSTLDLGSFYREEAVSLSAGIAFR